MDELNKIIDRYTEGNYLISNTAKEEMAKEILRLFNVVGQSELLVCDCPAHTYYEWEKEENKCCECGRPLYAN